MLFKMNNTVQNLALIRVEVLRPLLLVVGDAFQCRAVVPGAPMVVTQDAENTIALYCSVTTNHQPALRWIVTLL